MPVPGRLAVVPGASTPNIIRVANFTPHPLYFADEGISFGAINPTPGTGIAQAISASFSATAGLVRLRNTDPTINVYPLYIRLISTVVPASATSASIVVAVDTINRFVSGGSTLTPVNSNSGSAVTSVATVNVGALVLAAEGSGVRRLGRAQLSAVIPVLAEEYVIDFVGGVAPVSGQTLAGTTARRVTTSFDPIVLGAGHDFILHAWYPGNAATGASWEIEIAWIER